MAIDKDVLDWLLDGCDPQELFAKDGLHRELKEGSQCEFFRPRSTIIW